MTEARPPMDADKFNAISAIKLNSSRTTQAPETDKLTEPVNYPTAPTISLTESINSLREMVNSWPKPAKSPTKPVNFPIKPTNSQPAPIPNIPIQPKPPTCSSPAQIANPIMMMVPAPSSYFMPLMQQPIASPEKKAKSEASTNPQPVPIAPAGFGFIPVMAVPFSYAAMTGNSAFEMLTSYAQNPFISENMMPQFGAVDNKPPEVPKKPRGRPRKIRFSETAVSTPPLQKVPKIQDSPVGELNSPEKASMGTSPVSAQPKRQGRKSSKVNKLIYFPTTNEVQPMDDSNAMQKTVYPNDQQCKPVDYCIKDKD